MGLLGGGSNLTDIVVDELDDLNDVVLTAPTSGQTLILQNGIWVNASGAAGGASALDDLSDVTITSPTSGQTLILQGGVWVNASAAAAGGSGTVTSAGVVGLNGIVVAGSPVTTEGVFTLSLLDITPRAVVASGDISTAAGRITASAATITALLNGATASFSGIVSANAGLRATTVSASGVIGGSNLSGTNTGDQTITLTGDVSGSGTGSFATTINPASVTNAKLANMNAFTLKSNILSSAAVPADNTLSPVIDAAVSGAAHGDVLYRGNGTWTKLTAGTSGQFLRTAGVSANPFWGNVVAGTVTSAGVAGLNGIVVAGSPITTEGVVTLSLLDITPRAITASGDISTATGRITASAATITGLLTGGTASFGGIVSANAGLRATTVSASGVIGGSNLSGTNTGDQTITLTGDVSGSGTGSFAASLNPGVVDDTKLAQAPAKTIKANIATTSASPTNATISQLLDSCLGSAAGRVAYRDATGWVASALSGTGTVTSVSAGVGLVASTNPITATGEIRLDTSSQNAWNVQQYFATATLTDASAVAWNLRTQQVAQLTRAISGTANISDPTNMANGATYIMKVTKASANTATLTWASAYRWPGSTAPTLSTGSGATDIFTFVCVASVMYGSYTQNYSQP